MNKYLNKEEKNDKVPQNVHKAKTEPEWAGNAKHRKQQAVTAAFLILFSLVHFSCAKW